ncbi:MAG: hypothetical protein ACLQBJ_01360 [Bryobacteraceae bacterium]
MKRLSSYALSVAILAGASILAGLWAQQPAPPAQSGTPSQAAPAAVKKATAAKSAPAPMTNRDVIRLVKANISEELIIAKIKQSKTRFDTSVDGLVALKEAGVSDYLISIMMNPASAPAPAAAAAARATPASAAAASPAPSKPAFPASNRPSEVAASGAPGTPRRPAPKPAVVNSAPANYGVYIWSEGELKPLGRVQTKVQISKFRSMLKSVVPFVRQKIDIDIPGAHSASRYELLRPTFFGFFPPSRDVSKFKLLQCKITGQRFDQRTLANASILFSTEQNQDEVPCDIGPTAVKDLYRIYPREDLPSGEFGFVEGNTGSKSTSNIEILDVYDFAIDRKEDKMALKDYLQTLPAASAGDPAFLSWTREECDRIVVDRTGKVGLTGSMMGWFDRQYASLDVYWADAQFAHAFARLEMLDKNLTPGDAAKLAAMLLSADGSQYYVMVSIGGKVGSGKLIGANEGERLMRPFDASLASEKGKDVVPARHLDFIGGYAGLWKVTFDQQSIRGPLLQNGTPELVFEARLNQNLEFKARFQADKINAAVNSAPAGPR